MKYIGAIRTLVWFLACAYVIYLALPMQGVENVPANLDGSWRLALSIAFEKGLVFGRDINFTYGPLGFLAARALSESTGPLIKVYDAFIALQLILIPCFVYRRSKALSTLALLCGVLYQLAGARYFLDAAIILFLFSSFWLFEQIARPSSMKIILAVLNAILALYIKTNLGLAAVLQILAISLFQLCRPDSRARGAILLGITLGMLGFSTTFLKVDLLGYLRTSLHIANGYNDAMYMELTDTEYLYQSLVALGVAGACVVITMIFGKQVMLSLSCAGFLFLLFKQAFVRADGHIYVFFDYVFVPVGLLAFFSSGIVRWINSVALALLVAGSWWNGGDSGLFDPATRARLKWASLRGYQGSFEQKKAPPPSAVPPISNRLIEIVRQSPIDQIPDNAAILYYAGLNYTPRPVPQSYKSYDRYLDGLNGGFLAERGHPFFLITVGCVDYRYCFHDETQLKLMMLRHYDVVAQEYPYVLVQRRDVPLQMERTLVRTGRLKFGEALAIEPSHGLQVIEFDVDYSTRGKIRRFLYKPRELRISIKSEGKARSYRAIVPILRAGVITNVHVEDARLLDLFYGRRFSELPRVEKLRIHSKHPNHFKSSFSYRVYEITYK
jgi:hypothetical protein